MSAHPDPHVRYARFEATRSKIGRLVDEAVVLSGSDVPPADYFAELLDRVLEGLSAVSAAVWLRTERGELRLQHRAGRHDELDRQRHGELVRRVHELGRAVHLPPHSCLDPSTNVPDNPSELDLLFVPIPVDNSVAGLVEVWVKAGQEAAVPGYVQFLTDLADLAGGYLRQGQRREWSDRQQLWTSLESFSRQIHASLDPTQVAFLVANEGRRLVGCDRLSVGLGRGKRVVVEAVSGTDLVERRSNLVRRLEALCERVVGWGERLVYAGTRDEALPPGVFRALDAYLAESNAKLLVVEPLRDGREPNRRARSVLVAENYGPESDPGPLIARLESAGRHAVHALFNATEYRRIPLSWLGRPLAGVRESLGGRWRAAGLAAVAIAFLSLLVLISYPLKFEARGRLLPEVRRWVYALVEGKVVRFEEGLHSGSLVAERQALVLMSDVQLELRQLTLDQEIAAAQQAVEALARQEAGTGSEADRLRFSAERKQKEIYRDQKIQERKALCDRLHCDEGQPGTFWLTAPLAGTILNADFRETWTGRHVRPGEPLLRIGDKTRAWEVEVKIAQRHIGPVWNALNSGELGDELDVDLVLLTNPTRVFRGKLSRDRVTSQATPDRDDPSQPGPVVLASVRLDGPDIAAEDRVPPEFRLAGTEVHVKVRCGDRSLGYSLFHGLWEFLGEKVLFFF